jgi:DNA-binding helix-hairpin-helix protein with protein kinase domain
MATYKSEIGKIFRTKDAPICGCGEGNIHEIVDQDDYVAKIYHRHDYFFRAERERKILAMMKDGQEPAILKHVAWPVAALYDIDTGSFAGYAMPKVTDVAHLNTICRYGEQREQLSWDHFVTIAQNLSGASHDVHSLGQIVGDFNPNNVLVGNDGQVMLVDTDSFHISDGQGHVFRCTVGMGPFFPPEMQYIRDLSSAPLPTFTKESDRL